MKWIRGDRSIFGGLLPNKNLSPFILALLATWPLSVQAAASRIVALAPHLTELAFVAGAGSKLVGTVEYSDEPAAARAIPRLGDAFQVDMERLLAARPDLVLAWQAGTRDSLIARLQELGINVVTISTFEIEDVATAIRQIGELAGTSAIADRQAARFADEIGQLRRQYRTAVPITVFLQVDDQPLYTVNGRQLISQAAALCGGRNVFADLDQLAPAIGIEAVIAADPAVILSTDDSGDKAIGMWLAWPGMQAVRRKNLYTLRADDVARPTTRLVNGIREVCAVLGEARRK